VRDERTTAEMFELVVSVEKSVEHSSISIRLEGPIKMV